MKWHSIDNGVDRRSAHQYAVDGSTNMPLYAEATSLVLVPSAPRARQLTGSGAAWIPQEPDGKDRDVGPRPFGAVWPEPCGGSSCDALEASEERRDCVGRPWPADHAVCSDSAARYRRVGASRGMVVCLLPQRLNSLSSGSLWLSFSGHGGPWGRSFQDCHARIQRRSAEFD
jgi:hypothetical protein